MKKITDKIWTVAMNNVLVCSCLGTLALGLVIGGICVALNALLV